MKRVFLVHWNQEETRFYAAGLQSLGYAVETESDDGAKGYRRIKASPPDVVIIYLARLPSHGRETALALPTTESLCDLPLVFVGGKPKVVEQIKPLFPGAEFTSQDDINIAISGLSKSG